MLSVEEKTRLMNTARTPGFTLDGRPASLVGVYEPFATVWARGNKKGSTIQVEYAWETVLHIIDHGSREFKTT